MVVARVIQNICLRIAVKYLCHKINNIINNNLNDIRYKVKLLYRFYEISLMICSQSINAVTPKREEISAGFTRF